MKEIFVGFLLMMIAAIILLFLFVVTQVIGKFFLGFTLFAFLTVCAYFIGKAAL